MISASPTRSEDEQIQMVPYTIENTVYFPFFSSINPFPKRLEAYLLDTFNVTLEIKSISPTKIVLELKGQHTDVAGARPALASLFGSLKTKIYVDTNKCMILNMVIYFTMKNFSSLF